MVIKKKRKLKRLASGVRGYRPELTSRYTWKTLKEGTAAARSGTAVVAVQEKEAVERERREVVEGLLAKSMPEFGKRVLLDVVLKESRGEATANEKEAIASHVSAIAEATKLPPEEVKKALLKMAKGKIGFQKI